MKNILLTISSAALLLAACNTKKSDPLSSDKQVVFTDTSSLKNANASTDIAAAGTVAPAAVQQPAPAVQTITKVVKVYQNQPAAPPVVSQAPTPVATATPPVPVPASTPATIPATEPASTGTTATTGTGTGTTTTGTTTPSSAPAKKTGGWSGAAKDAAIGGVGGAVLGGVIGKGAKGAVIGGVIGAAGGYILGKKSDKKKADGDEASN